MQASTLQAFLRSFRSKHGKPDTFDYDDLHGFSIADPGAFWSELWDFLGIIGDKGEPPYLIHPDKMPGAEFFPGARLNYAENILAPRASGDALVFWDGGWVKSRVSWVELRRQVANFQAWLVKIGVRPGDRVAAVLPNHPSAIAAMLGTTSIGAVWSSCSPDFGADGIVDRFAQIEPRVLIVCDGYLYAEKSIDVRTKLAEAIGRLPTLEAVVVVDTIKLGGEFPPAKGTGADRPSMTTWETIQQEGTCDIPTFVRLPYSHPLCVLFSSGTTGVPKCIIHSAGGVLLKHMSECRLHLDVKPGDRVFYFTTLSWMMWNWLASCLGAGATLLLYDGSPLAPKETLLWDYADAEACTHFGTSAKYIDALRKRQVDIKKKHTLANLRVILSTGSPLAPEGFEYVYENIKADVHLASISGGTDLCGCFVIGNPLKPVWSGEIQGPALGVDIDIVDEEGWHVEHGSGELVCRRPFPSMPVGFWNDPDGDKYRNAYFTRFPGLWHHGDYAERTSHGGIIIHGRSDTTLNPGGVRIGTAEIYRQVEEISAVQESLVVGQSWDGDVRIVLFVVLAPGAVLDESLKRQIVGRIRNGCSPRHVPAKIVAVPDVPRTRSGKLAELAVRNVLLGRAIDNREVLANPESLRFYENVAELTKA